MTDAPQTPEDAGSLRRRVAKQTADRFQALIENAFDCVIVVAPDETVLYASPSALRLAGEGSEEALGHNAFENLHPDDQASARWAFRRVLERGGRTRLDVRSRPPGGEWRTYECVLDNQCDDPAVSGVVVNYRDVTERLLMEARLQRLESMELIGRLAGGAAHDFGNLVMAIRSFADLARTQTREGTRLREDIDKILLAAGRAQKLIERMLTYSRLDRPEKETLRIADVVREVLALLESDLPASVEVRAELEAGEGLVSADPTHAHRVVMNLCRNAIDAMREEGGTLGVRLELHDVDQALRVRLPGLGAGPHLRLTVSDTGEGILPDALPRIFDPFFTTKRGEGTGLGLAMVQTIVAAHQGAIDVRSTPGAGTTFDVYLPLAERQDPAVAG